jgi:hypothetical protein
MKAESKQKLQTHARNHGADQNEPHIPYEITKDRDGNKLKWKTCPKTVV